MPDYRALATAIHQQLGTRISAAVASTPNRLVSAAFLAGLISVENARLNPSAFRFEPAVFRKLQAVRDSWALLRSYNGIRHAQVADASDDALRALATSYSFTQIMGWHVLVAPLAQHSVAELRDPERHLLFAVQLLEFTAGSYLRNGNSASVLRIWNTGKPNGETYDPNYVGNALTMKHTYQLMFGN